MISMSMPLKPLWNQLTKSNGRVLACFWWSSSHAPQLPKWCPVDLHLSHHRHHRDPSSKDHLLASCPSMSSGIRWLLSSWSKGVTVLMASHSSAVQLTKPTYWHSTVRPVPRQCWWVINSSSTLKAKLLIEDHLDESPTLPQKLTYGCFAPSWSRYLLLILHHPRIRLFAATESWLLSLKMHSSPIYDTQIKKIKCVSGCITIYYNCVCIEYLLW